AGTPNEHGHWQRRETTHGLHCRCEQAAAAEEAQQSRADVGLHDTGIGIAPEHVPRLTERFYRVDRSRSRATGGTGLGLAIVKHVLLRHQAILDVMTELGRGSTFAVHLPPQRVRWSSSDNSIITADQATTVT